MDKKIDMYYWRTKKEYYKIIDGEVVFKDNTPKDILESYHKYKVTFKHLDDFKNRKDIEYGFLIKKYK